MYDYPLTRTPVTSVSTTLFHRRVFPLGAVVPPTIRFFDEAIGLTRKDGCPVTKFDTNMDLTSACPYDFDVQRISILQKMRQTELRVEFHVLSRRYWAGMVYALPFASALQYPPVRVLRDMLFAVDVIPEVDQLAYLEGFELTVSLDITAHYRGS